MKKILTTLFILICISSVLLSVSIDLAPYYAFAGIPVGSDVYKGTSGWVRNDAKYNSTTGTDGTWTPNGNNSSSFTDAEMIGLFTISSISYITSPVTITASAPNGLYMESQSEPAYRRPIEVLVFPKYTDGLSSDDIKNGYVILNNKKASYDFYADASSSKSYEHNSVWFDVVLFLPGTLNPATNEIEVTDSNNKTTYYNLVDASDYSCLVTFKVTYGDTSKTLTVPFTGYYDSSKNTSSANGQYKGLCDVSMNVVMNSNAYNINMEEDQGDWIDIGGISVLAGATEMSINGGDVIFEQYPVVFFSSSSDPFVQGDKFEMSLDSLKANDAHTNQNSLGFTLRVSVPELDSSVDGIEYSTSDYLTFDGTTYVTSALDGTVSTDSSAADYYKKKYADAGFIIPHKETAYTSRDGIHNNTVYYAYSSRIYLQLETSDVTMAAGRYTGDIYVHVMVMQ